MTENQFSNGSLVSFTVVPVIRNGGNVKTIRAEAHRANPAVI